MGSDQDFEAFLRERANDRIWSSGDSLGTHALQKPRAELHAIELIQLAKERGFRDNLMETQKAYGSVLEFVRHLMSQADPRLPLVIAPSREQPDCVAVQRASGQFPSIEGTRIHLLPCEWQ
jgi:hypothetical protein